MPCINATSMCYVCQNMVLSCRAAVTKIFLHLTESILKHKAMDYSKDLYNLSQAATFQIVDFENVIDVIRTCVTEVTIIPTHMNYLLSGDDCVEKKTHFCSVFRMYGTKD